MASSKFRYDVELRTLRGKPRTFRYFALERPARGPKVLRYHSDWFIAELIEHPTTDSDLGTRSQATDRTRVLRRELVRWLLVIDEPPLLRAVRDDDTVLSQREVERGNQPIFRALIAISEHIGDQR